MSKLLLLLTFILFNIISCQFDLNEPVTSSQDALDALESIQQQKTEIQRLFNEFKANANNIKTIIISNVKEDMKTMGISLGNRWRIGEEGTNSYEALVFRDMTTTNTGNDRRYAMFSGRYTDK